MTLLPIINVNDNEVFRNELLSRLATRDMANEKVVPRDKDARLMRLLEIEERYEDEFEVHELSRLILKKD